MSPPQVATLEVITEAPPNSPVDVKMAFMDGIQAENQFRMHVISPFIISDAINEEEVRKRGTLGEKQ